MARRFRFRLEPVLRLRELEEEERRKEFAIANRAVEEEELHRRSMLQERTQSQAEVKEVYVRGSGFEQVVDLYRYINSLDLELARSAQKLAQLQAACEEKRTAFVEAQKRRKALELLRDRQQQAHRREQERRAQTALDELAVQAARRRRD